MGKSLTTNEFIARAKNIHFNKYNYSKVNYVNVDTKVCIICPNHGEFWQTPYKHLIGRGCRICGNEKNSTIKTHTTAEFMVKAKGIHNDRYDYSKVNYVNNQTKVCIICANHGEFWQVPAYHLDGNGCPKCGNTAKLTTTEFISRARSRHGEKYDYSKTNYINANTKVCIICPDHGEFWQIPYEHIIGKGCIECSFIAKRNVIASKFFEKARKIHRDKYNYSKVEYIDSSTKVCIICAEHGEFWQSPIQHLKGCGCKKCADERTGNALRLSITDFKTKATQLYGDKYDYSKVHYVNSETKVCIICPIHGEFLQSPYNHLKGHECRKCGFITGSGKQTSNTETFIEKSRKIHGDKYGYSKVEYVNAFSKVCIVCPEHGEFWQVPSNHLMGNGCYACSYQQRADQNRKSVEDFIFEANDLYNNKYDYSKVEYVNSNTKVCIICPKHGEFWQAPSAHLQGHECSFCSTERNANKLKMTLEEFIERANKAHDFKYDYSKTNYVNSNTKICIICPEHGMFEQSPYDHLRGSSCPKCGLSKLEREILINFKSAKEQKTFEWLRLHKKLRLDFYIKEKNIAIECQGAQHFKPVVIFGNEEGFHKTLSRDQIKYNSCKTHGIEIIYFFPEEFLQYGLPFYDDKKCFHSVEEIKQYIKSLPDT